MKKIRLSVCVALAFLFMASCDDFVDVDLPDSLLTGPQVFDDASTVEAAMSDIYSKLRDEGMLNGSGSGGGASFGLYADELKGYYEAGNPLDNIFTNTLLPSNPAVQTFWSRSYHHIYCANAVIEGVAASASLSEAEKARFTSEALFVRAMVHFYLVNIFGDVPYISTTDFVQNSHAVRMGSAEVYGYIIEDLSLAIGLLPTEYVSTERARPNRAAAYAMLARAYLYSQQWAEAADAASAVLNAPDYTIEEDLDAVFLKEARSTIWQFKPKITGDNADEGGAYIFVSTPPPSMSLREDFISAFEPGDLRREHWTKSLTSDASTWYHAYKYKQNTNTGTSLEYSVVLRIEEQFLIRAEARARQGDLLGAQEDLNIIRQRAGLPDVVAGSAAELIEAVMRERRFELFTEYGHRFFDLKRSQTVDAVLSAVKPGWNITDALWPLPDTELLANPGLAPQNPGY